MNYEEAKEVVKNLKGETLTVNRIDYAYAKGFIEATEKERERAKWLVEALENCARWYRFKGQDGASEINGLDGLRLAQGVAEKAIAKYNESIKGEK